MSPKLHPELIRALDDFFSLDATGSLCQRKASAPLPSSHRSLSSSVSSWSISREFVLSARCSRRLPGLPRLESKLILRSSEIANVISASASAEQLLDAPVAWPLSLTALTKLNTFIGNIDGHLARNSGSFAESSTLISLGRCAVLKVFLPPASNDQPLESTVILDDDLVLESLREVNARPVQGRARSMSAERERESFFLKASLRLLHERDEQERRILDQYRFSQTVLPAPNEILKIGRVWKVRFTLYKPKFMAISPGRLVLCDMASDEGELVGREGKVIPLLRGHTFCRAMERSVLDGSRYPFELALGSPESDLTIKVLATTTKEERDEWIRTILTAASTELHSEALTELGAQCAQKRALFGELASQGRFLSLLYDLCCQGPIVIPIEWLQQTLQRPRGEVDSNFEQVMRDTSRDLVCVNGLIVEPSSTEAVIGALASALHSCLGGLADESTILHFCITCLLATNRTQCSGLAFEAVTTLLSPPPECVVVPSSLTQDPIEITVELVDIEPVSPGVFPSPPPSSPPPRHGHRRSGSMMSEGGRGYSFAEIRSKFERKKGDDSPKHGTRRTAANDKSSPTTEAHHKQPLFQCRISVRAKSRFSVVEPEEKLEVARVSAVFIRAFVVVGKRCVAVDQGRVVLTVDQSLDVVTTSNSPRAVSSPLLADESASGDD